MRPYSACPRTLKSLKIINTIIELETVFRKCHKNEANFRFYNIQKQQICLNNVFCTYSDYRLIINKK